MKRFIAAIVLCSLNLSIASAAQVKVKEVVYDSREQGFTIITEVENMCNAKLQYRLRGCTDLVVPYTCFVDVRADGGDACDENSIATGSVYLDELGLYRREMSGGSVVFQNEIGKTRKWVKLTVLK